MVHLSQIGKKLDLLSAESSDVNEFLTDIVENWSDYISRLNVYTSKSEGHLFEDPRKIEVDSLKNLLKLNFNQEDDNEFNLLADEQLNK